MNKAYHHNSFSATNAETRLSAVQPQIKLSDSYTGGVLGSYNIVSYVIGQEQQKNAACLLSRKVYRKISSYVHVNDRKIPPRAIAVLPPSLKLKNKDIIPIRTLNAHTRFGPVKGVCSSISNNFVQHLVNDAAVDKKPIFLKCNDLDNTSHIDVTDQDKSNWFSLLCLGERSNANLWLYEDDNELYGICTQEIERRTPLLLGYSKEYAETHNIPSDQPICDITEGLSDSPHTWWCTECKRSMASPSLLQRHIDVYHKDESFGKKLRRYRCRHCKRTFSRLFTLKRHLAMYCLKKSEKIDETIKKDESQLKAIREVSEKCTRLEDPKMTYDDSLHNYSGSLDFSTNLFDTDRIPNLDLSGSSKSESEYSCLQTDASFIQQLNGGNNTTNNNIFSNKKKIQKAESVICTHCNEKIAKGKQRHHVSVCSSRLECKCGRSFFDKEMLAQHVFTEHPQDEVLQTTDNSNPKAEDETYKCEDCNLVFKRRGMWVNHAWRAHGRRESAPLQRRARLYPCVACHKLYRSAAKRDRHCLQHHPDAAKTRGVCVEGARESVAAAACDACPRQYASRAKLLQHVRDKHPLLAPPVKKRKKGDENPGIEDQVLSAVTA